MKTEELYDLFREHPRLSTDTRRIIPGSLFFALRGENFDGNAFAEEALLKGAAYAVIDEQKYRKNDSYILVDNVLDELQQLARYHRRNFSIPVLAITGSNGKTTTKELIHAVLSTKSKTITTEGNLNNHIGVPLTLLRINTDTEFAVVEMGANHPGEIAKLCEIAAPGFGIITNIGKAHLEGFGSFEGVVKAKTELYRYLAEKGGTVFVSIDDTLLLEQARILKHKVIYGTVPCSGVRGKITSSEPFLSIEAIIGKETLGIRSRFFGDYNVHNLLAAAAVGSYFGVPPGSIRKAIESFEPSNSRSQVVKTEQNTLILDAYNANPTSMEMALRQFASSAFSNKAVLAGDMLELGAQSDKEHAKILGLLDELGFNTVFLVGPVFTRLNVKREWLCFGDSELARLWFEHHRTEGHSILVKGSRGIQLEKIVEVL